MKKVYSITQAQLDEDATRPSHHSSKYPNVTRPGEYHYSEADNEFYPIAQDATAQVVEQADFDGGFGIGGLSRYIEDPIIPTVKQMERQDQMERKAQYCRSCGCSDIFDGAMFSTDASSGLCDDCYG